MSQEGERIDNQNWREFSACDDSNVELFHPPVSYEGKPERQRREAAAKAICQGCLAIDYCREWALSSGEDYGVLGGMTETERRTVRRNAQRRRRVA